MRIKNIWITFLFFLFILNITAQSISFPDDDISRGYFDRSYLRYEAEPGKCETNGTFPEPTFDQRRIQSEASNQSAVQLIAKDSWIQWTNEKEADGITIRFSLPDDSEGMGTKGTVGIYVDGEPVETLELDSYWAWQYILRSGSKYPDNIPNAATKFPRMRFDEMHLKLQKAIPAKSTISIVKTDDNNIPYTIDFIELEKVPDPVTYESVSDENKILYTPEAGALNTFVTQNKGKTIFIPEGKYEVDDRIYLSGDGTKLIGAGMWYTEIYFTASSDDLRTYYKRGIECNSNNVVVEGMFLNTVNNKRYYDNNSSYQVGKGLMGSFGSNSAIRNLWIEHFECGGWIERAVNLQIEHCRFRNNYADGMNLSYGCENSVVEHSSYRNNGDDDMASWSRADRMCKNNIYRFSTSENNWRASALGFFGGEQNKAYNIVIIDPMEAGFRVTCDFPGMPFSTNGYSEFYNISVYKGGVAAGSVGVSGDLWGNEQGALHINSSSQYDLRNIKIYDINFYDSKNDAIFMGSSSKYIRNLGLKNISINGTGRYGIYFHNTKGNGTYCNIQYEKIGASSNTNPIPSSFSFTEDCSITSVPMINDQNIQLFCRDGNLHIIGEQNIKFSVIDILGRIRCQAQIIAQPTIVRDLNPGIYIVRWSSKYAAKVLVR